MEIERLYALYRNSAGVSTDTRRLKRDEIFFALRGPTHDGNRYIEKALGEGALAAVTDDPSLSGERIIFADDVLRTMSDLAALHRQRMHVPLIALTGTNGKTTTKELLAAILAKKGRVHSTPGNLNNHIGVPLTLLGAPDEPSFLVVEMGANHLGEITSLCKTARPTHGLITNIGVAHIEGFGSFENVARAKSELYQWLLGSSGTIIYDDDNPLLTSLAAGAPDAVPYSSPGRHSMRVTEDDGSGMLLSFRAEIDGSRYNGETRFFGAYNISNIRAAMATGLLFDIPVSDIIDAVTSYQPDNNRSQVVHTSRNTLICDAYNANPTSMESALISFASLKAEKKMVILGDMLELGSDSESEHSAVVRQIEGVGDLKLVLVGPRFMAAAQGMDVTRGKDAALFSTSDAVAGWLRQERPEGYTILIKGSRGMLLEKVYPML